VVTHTTATSATTWGMQRCGARSRQGCCIILRQHTSSHVDQKQLGIVETQDPTRPDYGVGRPGGSSGHKKK
jgi:hypothetical protein